MKLQLCVCLTGMTKPSVNLKAYVKGFQEQKTGLSCGCYSWRNETLKKVCQIFVNFQLLGVLSSIQWPHGVQNKN